MINTDAQKIKTIISRGVERIYPKDDFLQSRLSSGEQLTLYLGIDPTGPTLHMGHVIPLIKLAQFQELGHKIILLIGDFTARIGDPDKTQVRKPLSHQEILDNAKLYKEQAAIFLNFEGENPAELKYNGEWLDKMKFADVLELSAQMTVQRMLDRDMFRNRFFGKAVCSECGYKKTLGKRRSRRGKGLVETSTEEIMASGVNDVTFQPDGFRCPECENRLTVIGNSPIYLHEFMYPLMQGYDSVAMNVDGEVGGNDQTFNMLVGRDLLKNQNPPKEKFVIPMKLLVDSSGDKMGKTTGNMLSFLDSADEKFKKIMTWSDDMILPGFELLTDSDLESIQARLKSNENPRDIKFDLAHTIVEKFHNSELATKAKKSWINEVQKDNKPEIIPEIVLKDNCIETLAECSGESKSQIRRSLKEGAIRINGKKVTDTDFALRKNDEIQIGKKRWYKIKEK